jgi:hypothetical protein
LKEGCGVKNSLIAVVCIFLLLSTAEVSSALIYEFDGTVNSAPFKATMEINVSNNVLTISLHNTSPVNVISAISGFGVSLTNWSSVAGGLTWNFQTGGYTEKAADWKRLTGGVLDRQLYFYGYSAVFDALYNPNFTGLKGSDYTTPALFTVNLGGVPNLSLSLAPIIYVGNLGSTQNPYIIGSLVATPEPGTLLLLGLGLVGIGLIMREML